MEYSLQKEKYYNLLEPVISGLGHSIVELKGRPVQQQLHINLVIYNNNGVTIGDCADVHRAVMARVEMAEGERDIHLEVSSPGIGRNIKSLDEFEVFAGKSVKVLAGLDEDWIKGIIGGIQGNSADDNGEQIFQLMEKDETGNLVLKREIPVSDIRKAKLEES